MVRVRVGAKHGTSDASTLAAQWPSAQALRLTIKRQTGPTRCGDLTRPCVHGSALAIDARSVPCYSASRSSGYVVASALQMHALVRPTFGSRAIAVARELLGTSTPLVWCDDLCGTDQGSMEQATLVVL
jgi:hypothetical protein